MPCYNEHTDHNSFSQGAAVANGSGGSGGNSNYGSSDGGWGRSGSSSNNVTTKGDSTFTDCGTDDRGNQASLVYVNGQFLFMRVYPDGRISIFTSGQINAHKAPDHGHYEYDASGNDIFRNPLGGRDRADD